MFPAEQYGYIFAQGMLLLTLLTCVLYLRGTSGLLQSASFSAVAAPTLCVVLAVYLGTRPISGAFIDMTTYAVSYQICSMTGESTFPDWAFSSLMVFFSSYFEAKTFFLACAGIYMMPLLWLRKIHGQWAFAIVLAFAGSFSFFSYGVNVIRHGMAASLLLAAFCNRDRKWLMVGLVALSYGMHKSMLAPAVAFFFASLFNSQLTVVCAWSAWLAALVLSRATGGAISEKITSLSMFASDERFIRYATGVGNDRGGFRWDFILYSITPVAITYALAGPVVRKDPFYRALLITFLITNAFWLLVIYAAYSDRFAYLSWFLLPWLICYPFTPKADAPHMAQSEHALPTRLGLLSATLAAHFAFTYFMQMVYYRGAFQ